MTWTVIRDSPMRKTWLDNRSDTTITVVPEKPVMKKEPVELPMRYRPEPEVEKWNYSMLVQRPGRGAEKSTAEKATAPDMDTAARRVKTLMMRYGKSMPPQVIDIPAPIAPVIVKPPRQMKVKAKKSKKSMIDRAIKMVRG